MLRPISPKAREVVWCHTAFLPQHAAPLRIGRRKARQAWTCRGGAGAGFVAGLGFGAEATDALTTSNRHNLLFGKRVCDKVTQSVVARHITFSKKLEII